MIIDEQPALTVAKSLEILDEGIPNIRLFGTERRGISITSDSNEKVSKILTKIKDALKQKGFSLDQNEKMFRKVDLSEL